MFLTNYFDIKQLHHLKIKIILSLKKQYLFATLLLIFIVSCGSNQFKPYSKSDSSLSDSSKSDGSLVRSASKHTKKPISKNTKKNLIPVIAKDLKLVGDEQSFNFQSYINGFLKKDAGLIKRSTIRARMYLYHIQQEVKKRNIPMEIALLPFVESSFIPNARSHAAAVGIWQFIRSTGQLYNLDIDLWKDDRKDVIKSTEAALNYLEYLYKEQGDWLLALAAYNSGSGRVNRSRRKYNLFNNRHINSKVTFWEIRKYLPPETRHYVPQLLAVSYIFKHANDLGVDLPVIKNEPYFESIKTNKQVDLKTLSRFSGLSKKDVNLLNAQYIRGITPPKKSTVLVLPKETVAKVKYHLDNTPYKIPAISLVRYKIRKGDTLSSIAARFSVSVKAIKKTNRLRTSRIYVNKKLILPTLNNTKRKNKAKYIYYNYKKAEKNEKVKSYRVAKTPVKTNKKAINNKNFQQKTKASENQKSKTLLISYLDYKVSKNDTLTSIANRFDVKISDIKSIDTDLSKNPSLQIGQNLKIYNNKSELLKFQNNNKIAISDTNSLQKIKNITNKFIKSQKKTSTLKNTLYKVRSGDSLWSIATSFGISTRTLARQNNLSMNSILSIGKSLKIKYDLKKTYTIRRGDTLWDIANRFKTTVGNLKKKNGLTKNNILQIGSTISLP